MTSAVSRLLKDFGAPDRPQRGQRSLPGATRSDDRAPAPIAPVVDVEAVRVAAYEEGWRAAAEECAAHSAAEAAAREKAHEEALAALARRHEEEVAGHVAQAVAALLPGAVGQVSDLLAGILAPLLTEDLTSRMLEAFAADLSRALGEERTASVRVSGPRALFDRLAARLEGSGVALLHVEAEAVDLSFEVDGTTVETRLSAWTRALSEALS